MNQTAINFDAALPESYYDRAMSDAREAGHVGAGDRQISQERGPGKEEIWKEIPGFRGQYHVSSLGAIKGKESKKIYVATNGYRQCSLSLDGMAKTVLVHRALMMAFAPIGNYASMQVNHIDGIKTNNDLSNLEWVTAKENALHRHHVLNKKTVSTRRGADNGYARPVRKILSNGESIYFNSIADAVKAGYRASCIVEVCRGTQKKHSGCSWEYASAPLRKGHSTAGGRIWALNV